jgi:abortive infection bacteriophage resistance protein
MNKYIDEKQSIKKNYDKKPLTYKEQLNKLIERGLIIEDEEEALNLISHINYYHLEAYWYSFYQKNEENKEHVFCPGVTFNNIWNIYTFDRKLRSLFVKALERIEISFRTQFVYYVSHGASAFPFDEEVFGFNEPYYTKTGILRDEKEFSLKKLRKDIQNNSNENYIKHFYSIYNNEIPPIWMVGEILSFGSVSCWFSKIIDKDIKENISAIYGVSPKVLKSWMQHLIYIRNCCAHHGRLWNRICTITPSTKTKVIETKMNSEMIGEIFNNERRIYNTILIIDYLWDLLCFDNDYPWRFKVLDLIHEYKIEEKVMGFPENWEKDPYWSKERDFSGKKFL